MGVKGLGIGLVVAVALYILLLLALCLESGVLPIKMFLTQEAEAML